MEMKAVIQQMNLMVGTGWENQGSSFPRTPAFCDKKEPFWPHICLTFNMSLTEILSPIAQCPHQPSAALQEASPFKNMFLFEMHSFKWFVFKNEESFWINIILVRKKKVVIW